VESNYFNIERYFPKSIAGTKKSCVPERRCGFVRADIAAVEVVPTAKGKTIDATGAEGAFPPPRREYGKVIRLVKRDFR